MLTKLTLYSFTLCLLFSFGKIQGQVVSTDSLLLEDDPAYVEGVLRRLERNGQDESYTQTLLILADVMRERKKYPQALDYYLRASRVFNELDKIEEAAAVSQQIGQLYTDWELHEKALEFYLQSYTLRKKKLEQPDAELTELLEKIGFSYLKAEQYEKTIASFVRLAAVYRQEGKVYALRKKYKQLADVHKVLDQYEKALDYNLKILDLDRTLGDSSQVAATLNNLGFLYKFLDQPRSSLRYFKQSLNTYQQLLSEGDATDEAGQRQLSIILDNLGFLELYLGNSDSALHYFEQGLEYKQQLEDKRGIAASYNHLAVAHMMLKNYYPAKNYAEQALVIAQEQEDIATQLDSYQQLARLHESLKQYRKALGYQKKYTEKREEVFAQKQVELEEEFQRRYVGERQEKNMRLMVIDREIDNLNVQRLELEAEQKEKDVEILRKEKRLQEYMIRQKQLERERALQELEIARRQLESEKKDSRIQALAKENQLRQQSLELQEVREKERLREIELLESRQAIDQLKIQEQERERKLFIAIGLLLALVLLLALIGFIQKQRANGKLRRQSKEIRKKNDELAAQKEEIQLTANQLREANIVVNSKNEELEEKNRRITDSIRYAQSIQTAILPTPPEFDALFSEHFILYRPKDIVSGDFYWLVRLPRRKITFLAVVDCTGHGVPGAFMSMIGHTLLSEIVNEKNCHEPAEILTILDQEIRAGLRQKEQANRDGMDLGLCRISQGENDKVEVVFSGAKRSLYLIRQAKGTLERIKGTNRSIGGKERKSHHRPFEAVTLLLDKDDLLYMSTDGFADQANPKLQKFGSHNLRQLIEKHHQKPLAEQAVMLESALDIHQKSAEQRDDITLIGVRV